MKYSSWFICHLSYLYVFNTESHYYCMNTIVLTVPVVRMYTLYLCLLDIHTIRTQYLVSEYSTSSRYSGIRYCTDPSKINIYIYWVSDSTSFLLYVFRVLLNPKHHIHTTVTTPTAQSSSHPIGSQRYAWPRQRTLWCLTRNCANTSSACPAHACWPGRWVHPGGSRIPATSGCQQASSTRAASRRRKSKTGAPPRLKRTVSAYKYYD